MGLKIRYPLVGICGLSCRLCPNYHMGTKSRCLGCKSKDRMAVGCPFITCALKKKGREKELEKGRKKRIEFCWDCKEHKACKKWKSHRAAGKKSDSFKCYQKLEEDILFIQKNGVAKFEKNQKIREQLLNEMLQNFNEGRSKSYYCIAATVFDIKELNRALISAKRNSKGMGIRERSMLLHRILDKIALQKQYCLKLRK
jgi:hypothetical protein